MTQINGNGDNDPLKKILTGPWIRLVLYVGLGVWAWADLNNRTNNLEQADADLRTYIVDGDTGLHSRISDAMLRWQQENERRQSGMELALERLENIRLIEQRVQIIERTLDARTQLANEFIELRPIIRQTQEDLRILEREFRGYRETTMKPIVAE